MLIENKTCTGPQRVGAFLCLPSSDHFRIRTEFFGWFSLRFAHNYVPLQSRKLKIYMKTKEILMLCASALLVLACGDDDAKEGSDDYNIGW